MTLFGFDWVAAARATDSLRIWYVISAPMTSTVNCIIRHWTYVRTLFMCYILIEKSQDQLNIILSISNKKPKQCCVFCKQNKLKINLFLWISLELSHSNESVSNKTMANNVQELISSLPDDKIGEKINIHNRTKYFHSNDVCLRKMQFSSLFPTNNRLSLQNLIENYAN